MSETVDVESCAIMAARHINSVLSEKTGFWKEEIVSVNIIACLFRQVSGSRGGDFQNAYIESRMVFALLNANGFPPEFMDQCVKIGIFGQEELTRFTHGKRVTLGEGFKWAEQYRTWR